MPFALRNDMRVISGQVGGQRLKTPKTIRPTTQLVRGAIFSMLEARGRSWGRMLELYAGSGALGIEALSRGAERVDFVERDERCCTIIKENLAILDFSELAHVYCCDVRKALTFLKADYDVIILDPPYSEALLDKILVTLVTSQAASVCSTIVVQHSIRQKLQTQYNGMTLLKERRYGDTCVTLYGKEAVA